MEKSYIQKITAFIDNMRNNNEESTPSMNLLPLVDNTEYNITDIVFDTTKTPNIKDFTLEESEQGKFAELCGFNIQDGGRHTGTGLIIADYSGLTPPGGSPLPENSFALGTSEGFYPVYISNREILDTFFIGALGYDNAVVGWNGASFIEANNKFDSDPFSENAVVTTVIPEDANEPVYNGKLVGTKE